MTGTVEVRRALKAEAAISPIMETPMVEIEHLSLWYGEKLALREVGMLVPKHRVTAYIGPSGCGKSTLLRCLNRMNDLVDGVKIAGSIRIGGTDIYDVGFQSPNVDAARPMVFMTTLLLLAIVVFMNLFAIGLRNRLRRKYATAAV